MPAVLAAGVKFIGVKATDGLTGTDATLREHRRLCQGGVAQDALALTIYYHFARPGLATAQADRLMAAVGMLGPRERLCLDLEGQMPEVPSRMLGWLDAFYDRLDRYYPGAEHLVYTSANVWDSMGNPPWARAAQVALWAPRYNQAMVEPRLPKPWQARGWHFWQWSDGDTPSFEIGNAGRFDANYFRSDEAALRSWVAATAGLDRKPSSVS